MTLCIGRSLAAGALAIAGALVTACGGGDPALVCTEIGCSDGLAVEVSGQPPVSYTVRVLTVEGSPHEQECGTGSACDGHAFFPGLTPDSATVQVLAGDSVLAETALRPEYRRVRPNGPGCPPECLQATVTLAIP